jgi:hypothetical protein
MSIIAASLYRNGKRVGPVSLDQPVPCATDRSEFVWIGLFEPSEAELCQLQENYDLHPLAIEDARRLGGDPCGADGDRRHLRHEFRQYARVEDGLWLFHRSRRHRAALLWTVRPVQEGKVALASKEAPGLAAKSL